MFKVFKVLLVVSLIMPAQSAGTTFNFYETFTCATGLPFNVKAKLCEIDSFGDDCTEFKEKNCGGPCTIELQWSGDGDEWPGTEYEFSVDYVSTCGDRAGYVWSAGPYDLPIDGPAVRNVYHTNNLE